MIRVSHRFCTLFALGSVSIAGCDDPPMPGRTEPVAVGQPPERTCPEGFVSAEDGLACDVVLPVEPCAPGTMPVLGGTCRAVGTTFCADGFVANPSGWGCLDVLSDEVCEGATAEVLGQTDCQPVGDCSGPFPSPGATHFVDDDYLDTEVDATHFQTLGAALSAAPPGAIIAVEAGTYTETLGIAKPVVIAGRCPAEVIVAGTPGSGEAGIRVSAPGVEIRGMTVTGHFNGAIAAAGAEVEWSEMVFDKNRVTGLQANDGALVTLRDSVLRDGFDPDQEVFGYGIFATGGASVALISTSITRNTRAGIVAFDAGTRITAERCVFRENRPRTNGNDGNALVLSGGTSAEVSASVMAGNGQVSLLIEGTDPRVPTVAVLRDSVIRDTLLHSIGFSPPGQPGFVEYFGWNVSAQGNASLRVESSSLLRSGGAALVTALAPAEVEMIDSVIEGTGVLPDGHGTAGAAIQAGGKLTVTRSAIVGGSAIGLQLFGGSLVLDDSLVADTRSQGAGNHGHGIQASREASVTSHRSALLRNAGSAILSARVLGGIEAPGEVSFQNGIIADGVGYDDGSFGRALDVSHGAKVDVLHSAVVNNREVAVRAADLDTVVRITGSVIAGTRSDGAGRAGRAVNVQQGARIELVGSLLRDNRDVSLLVGQPSSTASVRDSVIVRTLARESDGMFGLGALSIQGGAIELAGVTTKENAAIGFAISAASASISQCLFASNPVALQVQDGSTLREVDFVEALPAPLEVVVTRDTQFIDNGARLGTAAIPLPDLFVD